jgi:hypothetical protein
MTKDAERFRDSGSGGNVEAKVLEIAYFRRRSSSYSGQIARDDDGQTVRAADSPRAPQADAPQGAASRE